MTKATKYLVHNTVTGHYYRRGEHFCVPPTDVQNASLVDDQELAVLNATYLGVKATPVTSDSTERNQALDSLYEYACENAVWRLGQPHDR